MLLGNRNKPLSRLGWVAVAGVAALMAAGCSSSSSTSSTAPSSSAPAASSSAASSSAPASSGVPAGLSVSSFTTDIASTTRWVDFDAPYWTTALTAAGLSSSQFKIDNAQGSDATQLSDATADI